MHYCLLDDMFHFSHRFTSRIEVGNLMSHQELVCHINSTPTQQASSTLQELYRNITAHQGEWFILQYMIYCSLFRFMRACGVHSKSPTKPMGTLRLWHGSSLGKAEQPHSGFSWELPTPWRRQRLWKTSIKMGACHVIHVWWAKNIQRFVSFLIKLWESCDRHTSHQSSNRTPNAISHGCAAEVMRAKKASRKKWEPSGVIKHGWLENPWTSPNSMELFMGKSTKNWGFDRNIPYKWRFSQESIIHRWSIIVYFHLFSVASHVWLHQRVSYQVYEVQPAYVYHFDS